MTEKKRVIVGMSGGVDSAVSALLLKEQGYDVIGVFMKNWEEEDEDGVCLSDRDAADVRAVCAQLDIPYYPVNFAKQYWQRVFAYFLDEHKKGRTPNPDVLCNREIKFRAFLDFALTLGADHLATGHFCQLDTDESGNPRLLRGADENKDQSYFLHALSGEQLSRVLFPVGHMTKTQVRQVAKENGLSVAGKKDSTGICFIGERNFKSFLQKYLPAQPGDIVTPQGEIVGKHDGLMYYTLGQRKGLGIGGLHESVANGNPWFVVAKDMTNNHLIVTQGEGKELLSSGLVASLPSWIAGHAPAQSFACTAKFRYRQPDVDVHVTCVGDEFHVAYDVPQRAITPGQFAVFYQGPVCLGGATIEYTIM